MNVVCGIIYALILAMAAYIIFSRRVSSKGTWEQVISRTHEKYMRHKCMNVLILVFQVALYGWLLFFTAK